MSKTDKTRPFHVRLKEWKTAVHDHSDGLCNLPEKIVAGGRRYGRHDCYWLYTPAQIMEQQTCGCSLCTGKIYRKMENRKTRHMKKKDIESRLD